MVRDFPAGDGNVANLFYSVLAAAQLERPQFAGDAGQESTVEVDQFSRKLGAL